jgi:hypothetical protein
MSDQSPARLTKAELAALDLIIAEAEEAGGGSVTSPLVAPVVVAAAVPVLKFVARAFVAGAAAEAGAAFFRRIAGIPFPENVRDPSAAASREMEARVIEEQLGTRPSLESLKRVRDLLASK